MGIAPSNAEMVFESQVNISHIHIYIFFLCNQDLKGKITLKKKKKKKRILYQQLLPNLGHQPALPSTSGHKLGLLQLLN